MPEYIAHVDTLIAHECRVVKAGERFTTVFPDVGGKPMRLSGNIELVKPGKVREPKPDIQPQG